MSGVDNMIYMYSVNANNGLMTLRVNFDVSTDPNNDQILTQMRYLQAESQLPQEVQELRRHDQEIDRQPRWSLFSLYSPERNLRRIFLANYAYINLNDPDDAACLASGSVTIFGAGQYAMRFWVRPDQLAKLDITVPEIITRDQAAEHRQPGRPDRRRAGPRGTGFYLHRPGAGPAGSARRSSATSSSAPTRDGSIVRLKDVARIELGAQNYSIDRPAERQARRAHGHLPASGLQRDRRRERRARS